MTITTILLDLDNTLLGNDMRDFLPPYFATLEKRLRHLREISHLSQLMSASIQAMQADREATLTNMARFMADFSKRLDCQPEALQEVFELFYREDYPHLQQYTSLRQEGREVVEYLLAGGYKLVIATNPLFPTGAIEQRLAWAGIAGFPYTLVTTMDNSHFSKPDPLYYREILAKTESTPEESWMVGDDPENDIEPAQAVGLKTWWITDAVTDPSQITLKTVPDKQGSLAEFLAWIKRDGLSILVD